MKKRIVNKHNSLRHIWYYMLKRCFDEKDQAFNRYGGRGITVCRKWVDFSNFEKDMGEKYQIGLTLERIDNNKGYSPTNCKWATRAEQNNNKRNNRTILYNGIKRNLSQWIKLLGLKSSTVRQRYYVYKWNIEKCFNYGKGAF